MPIEYLSFENMSEALDFAEKSHGDSAWKDYPFQREALYKNLIKMVENKAHFTCLYRKGDEIVGYWFASLCVLLFSEKLRGEENGIYIAPEHRGGRVAFRMYLEYKRWCERHNAEPIAQVQFGDAESNEKAYAFFRALGMVECGRIFRGGDYGLRQSD